MIITDLECRIEKSKDDYNILQVNKDNKWIYIGSKYNMKSTIDKFIDGILEEKEIDKKILFIYGFGTGEHIKALCSKLSNRIIVFEPNEALGGYISALQWINDYKNLTVLCCKEDYLKDYLKDELGDFQADKIKIIPFDNYGKVFSDEYYNILDVIKKVIWNIQIEINTAMSYSKRWFDSFITNLEFIVQGVPSNVYKDKYKGKPAIIVSAGPSLEKNIEQLKKVNGDFLILVGGRTLRSVLEIGVKPSLMANIDPSERNYNLVKGYIEDTNIPILFYEGTNEKIIKNHKGKKIFFTQKKFIEDMAEIQSENYTFGGSVAHVATGFATHLGCSPIVFIGQDLAHTGEKMYAKISADQNNINSINQKSASELVVEAVGGGKVKTSPVLYGFKQEFENFIELNKSTTLYINATEGGARIKGTIEMPLEKVIEVYGGNKVESFDKIEIDYDVNIKEKAIKMLTESEKSAQKIVSYTEKAILNTKELREVYKEKNEKKINSLLLKLERIDKKINRESEKLDIADSLMYPLYFSAITSNNDLKDKGEFEGEADEILDNSYRIYRNLNTNFKYAANSLGKLIRKLEGISELEFLVGKLGL